MRKALIFIIVICVCTTLSFATMGGTEQDPLVTLSYITGEFLDNLNKKASERMNELFSQKNENYNTKIDNAFDEYNKKAEAKSYENAIAEKAYIEYLKRGTPVKVDFAQINLHEGDILLAGLGTEFIMNSGSGNIYYNGDCAILNLSEGTEEANGKKITTGYEYLVASNAECGVKVIQNNTSFYVVGDYTVKKAYDAQFTKMADGLFNIGLFKGTNYGYELDKSASRIEALVMLIRLLGEEEQALNFDGVNPFNDVDAWADRYVAYAYDKGYTKGVSETKFSPSVTITADQYTTFVMRALGYDDNAGDFVWDNSVEFARQKDILSDNERIAVKTGIFRRDYMVFISCRGLFAKIKDAKIRLLDKLIIDGIIDSYKFDDSENLLKNI